MEELRGGADVVLKKIMRQAASERASDVHIEPGASFVRVRFRKDGLLSDRFCLSSSMAPNLSVRVKVLGRLDVGESRLPQDGSWAEEIDGVPYDFRISVLPSMYGETIVIRILSGRVNFIEKNELGMRREQESLFRRALAKGQGLILTTGPTGSGKTTILWLLLRFYDPDSGAVRLNGRDVRSIPPEVLHSKFGVVFQNDFLYADEIGENIDFGRGISPEQTAAAARTAQADFIAQRKGGFSAQLAAKGANLSGGQKQRVLLARALAADPEILLLDDSSSALDYKTDAALRRALARDFADTTKIIVAQRVSSIQNADRILVLEDGRAAGLGTHSELLRSCESYREIAQVQMGEVE